MKPKMTMSQLRRIAGTKEKEGQKPKNIKTATPKSSGMVSRPRGKY